MNIIGISAFYHDSACCIIKDGRLISAVQEERFTRIKNDPSLPVNSFKHCLKESKLSIEDIDCVAYYENPIKKLSRQLWSGFDYFDPGLKEKMDPRRPEIAIREKLGYEGEIKFIDHHMSHAASSFHYSGFDRAAIFTVDGVGEWATTTYGVGKENGIEIFEEVNFPNSLGLLYSTITNYLGFKVNNGEYKVMGLAPYGRPIYVNHLKDVITSSNEGQYRLNMDYFDFTKGGQMFTEELVDLLGKAPRERESELLQYHKDIAKSLQVITQDLLLEKANYLQAKTGEENLCMAGGVALNCVANGHIIRNSSFKNLFVQPASNDAGGALGAAAAAYTELTGKKIEPSPMKTAFYGSGYSAKQVDSIIKESPFKSKYFKGRKEDLLKATAELIAAGKVIGWFQGKTEFGPRALGARSILGDPRNPDMRSIINQKVKKREGFRPFAPVILEEKAEIYFDLDHPSPFMLETCQVHKIHDLPSITHVDGSARVQTVNRKYSPLFAELLDAFEALTGCPILLNTSFNVRGEPIVNSPSDAIACFVNADLDALIIEESIIEREEETIEVFKNLQIPFLIMADREIEMDRGIYTFI
ncbi:MAG: carbamoyltransferase [Crocinitomix sp.]|jgi:carbamoyltransferase